jgi:hypothetical protein
MIAWLATARLDVLKLAVVLPAVVESVPCPMLVAPSENVTTPVGLPEPATVAVNVTLCPHTDEAAEDTTDVAVVAFATVCVMACETLVAKFASPP